MRAPEPWISTHKSKPSENVGTHTKKRRAASANERIFDRRKIQSYESFADRADSGLAPLGPKIRSGRGKVSMLDECLHSVPDQALRVACGWGNPWELTRIVV
ncbi:hypothetical protein CH375_14105 [Leptospira ellisii]|uniref:Uncharacterized protein n=1 Tax=Leptospira ellisii TaxID=2023197 RepID=A0A2N0BIU6_9LEPT|nr:hypothetical protein CH379_19875 [Leptospira ellisii]PKA03922.1 hypothetical protein CH375_14105 [Leptospira ellisii]